MRTLLLAVALVAGLGCFQGRETQAQTPSLTIADRGTSRTVSRTEFLADRRLQNVAIAYDPVYRRPMTYRGIAVSELLKGYRIGDDDYVQARAYDNFSVSIPAGLLTSTSPSSAEAFLAVEDPAMPWPAIPGTSKGSAGPFYIVWRGGTRSEISSEYWAYHLAALTVTDSPFKRWPGLAVAAEVPATDPIRRGLDRFVAVCMACHRFNGEGEGEQGPDLARPMNPVDYFQPAILKKYLRNPSSVRTWPEQKMPAFDEENLSDADIDAIVAWLGYKARK
ncbi:MAG: cytochrome c [Reyranella sp.]|uniref:c-type cytochrome n=1 Tax=Reyranella sp. TaxID=1929291 RepID=UPI00272FB18A|nr:cytochrome c [Reyranella sp.]MDP1966167.1 cytochrome c [Reyranella sp.]MDP2377620.1 cytochrome c [Reyranella sp.]